MRFEPLNQQNYNNETYYIFVNVTFGSLKCWSFKSNFSWCSIINERLISIPTCQLQIFILKTSKSFYSSFPIIFQFLTFIPPGNLPVAICSKDEKERKEGKTISSTTQNRSKNLIKCLCRACYFISLFLLFVLYWSIKKKSTKKLFFFYFTVLLLTFLEFLGNFFVLTKL